MRDWEGREATRSSRKSGNLACCNGKRPHQLREKSKWRQSKQALQLSSLDALDLPMESGGVFIFSHKRHRKHTNCLCGKRVKFMRRIFVSILLVVASIATIQAQTGSGAISGYIKDPQGANVPGATVRLYGRDRTFSLVTVTDANGAYSFKNLAPGEYLVEAEAKGFAVAPAQTLNVERGKETTLSTTLELSGLRSTVVITASDTPQTVDEVSKALTVVRDQ